jgi:hypothetical protein
MPLNNGCPSKISSTIDIFEECGQSFPHSVLKMGFRFDFSHESGMGCPGQKKMMKAFSNQNNPTNGD